MLLFWKKLLNSFGGYLYLLYFCSRNDKNLRPVTLRGTTLSNKKMNDFIAKVDEVQRSLNAQGLCYTIIDICRMAAAMPAPQFYIEPSKALWMYNLYLKGKSSIHSVPKRRMYAEIFSRYEHLVNIMRASGQRVCKREVMAKVVNQEAPSFYYGDSAFRMYYYWMSKKRKKHLWYIYSL